MAAERVFESRSPAATEALGEALGRALRAGDVVALEGELGSGKTCFVRGLARGLGVRDPVTSPTYTLMQSYEGKGARFEHFDAYLEGRERAFLLDGGAECLGGEAVCAVEWADRVQDLLPEPRVRVRLTQLEPEVRRVALAVVGGGAGRLAAILAGLAGPPGTAEEAAGRERAPADG